MMNLDIIVLLVVVALIFQRLWRVLGTRPEEPQHRVKLSREGAEKLYNLLKSEAEKNFKQVAAEVEELIPADKENLSETDAVLVQIPSFDKNNFVQGAQKAFRAIIEAFNGKDIETLKMLVDESILKKMKQVIKQREADGITAETDFICFDKSEISKAKLEKNKAFVSVEFVSEQANVLRDKEGKIIEGDENYIQTITDVWTFEKDLNPEVVNWMLVSTKKS